MPASWKIAGSYFEACNCEVACPCVFTSPPTGGECTVLIAWHIDQGSFGEIDLDGLNTVLAAHSPGHMLEGKWKVALYVPGFPAVVAKSKQMRFSDYGLKWDVSNKNGFFSPFAYQSA